jgi:hypothetical protein
MSEYVCGVSTRVQPSGFQQKQLRGPYTAACHHDSGQHAPHSSVGQFHRHHYSRPGRPPEVLPVPQQSRGARGCWGQTASGSYVQSVTTPTSLSMTKRRRGGELHGSVARLALRQRVQHSGRTTRRVVRRQSCGLVQSGCRHITSVCSRPY